MGRASHPHAPRCVWRVCALAEAHLWYLELKGFADTKVKFVWGTEAQINFNAAKEGNWLI